MEKNLVSILTAGDTVTVECGFDENSYRGNPEPLLSLSIDGLIMIESSRENIIWMFQVGSEHQGSILDCLAINDMMAAPLHSFTTLEVICKYTHYTHILKL